MVNRKKKLFLILCIMLMACVCCSCKKKNTDEKKDIQRKEYEEACNTPFGRYPKKIVYTLGKMTASNNSNMPKGDTYENNAYTRYLNKKLNIQSEDIIEASESEDYQETLSLQIASGDLPDIFVVDDIETLRLLVERDMIQDLTEVYKKCSSQRIKNIYKSYDKQIFEDVTFSGKMMALPETNIESGPSFLWLRKDWIDKLGIDPPKTMDDVCNIIKQFREKDPGNNGVGQTIGLPCDDNLTGEEDYDYEYQTDICFAKYGAYPKRWIYDKNGKIVYSSVQPEAKEGLRYLRKLYKEGILDRNFLIRGKTNIIKSVINGTCGAFFGPWWSPNNPLMDAMKKNPCANWRPYRIATDKNGVTSYASQSPSSKWIVVRKGYKHPEIVMKIVSVLFDDISYGDKDAKELGEYYRKNVDPTARPLSINVDYSDALVRCYHSLQEALETKKSSAKLNILEGSYYESCLSYINNKGIDPNDWAAYMSRIAACSLLNKKKLNKVDTISNFMDVSMKKQWWKLREMEKQAYLQIITGDQPIDYFDEFVEEWKKQGGEKITEQMQKRG